jgi:membrane protease YdiL (CAAX protease family)
VNTAASSGGKAELRGLLLTALVLAVYLALLLSTEGKRSNAAVWFRLSAPNLWLIATGLPLAKKWFPELAVARGGRRIPVFAGVSLAVCALIVWIAFFWPSRPGFEAPGTLVRALLIVFLAPVAEEIYFRGLLLGHLQRTTGAAPSVLLVSALFGLLHLPQGLHWTMAVLSLVLCLATLWSGSLLWAVTLHIGWNGASMVRTLPQGPWRWVLTGLTVSVMALLIARGIGTRRPKDGKTCGAP